MVSRNHIGYWVPLAVWFANQPDSTSDAEAEKVLRVRLDDEHSNWDAQWMPPAVGYQRLRKEWRRYLATRTTAGKKMFRSWCERNTDGLTGPLLYRYERSERFGLGPPVRTNRPEALLANVGLAVLTDPAARISRCSCSRFFLLSPTVGKPPKFCPECRAAKRRPSDLSTPRVRKLRSKS